MERLVAVRLLQVLACGTERSEVVVDAANVLSADAEERINRIAFSVKQRTGGELALVTLPDIGQRDAADIAREIGNPRAASLLELNLAEEQNAASKLERQAKRGRAVRAD